jgi:hypothetical protein
LEKRGEGRFLEEYVFSIMDSLVTLFAEVISELKGEIYDLFIYDPVS